MVVQIFSGRIAHLEEITTVLSELFIRSSRIKELLYHPFSFFTKKYPSQFVHSSEKHKRRQCITLYGCTMSDTQTILIFYHASEVLCLAGHLMLICMRKCST